MTSAVLNRAIAECAGWHAAGRDLIVSVNLSIRNLHDPLLSSQIGQLLQLFRLPPQSLKLEITESMILSDPQRALKTVQSLSDLGCGSPSTISAPATRRLRTCDASRSTNSRSTARS